MRKLLFPILLLMLAAVAMAQTVTIGSLSWIVRTGKNGVPTYKASNVTKLADGRVKMVTAADGSSAGIMLPRSLGYGTYEVTLEGRFDAMFPHGCGAFWFYDDDAGRLLNTEFDIEVSYWGDENNPNALLLTLAGTAMVDPVPEYQVRLPARSFSKHRWTLTYFPDRAGAKCEGWWNLNKRWMVYGQFERARKLPPNLKPRLALWQYPKGSWFPGVARGMTTMYAIDSKFTPYQAPAISRSK